MKRRFECVVETADISTIAVSCVVIYVLRLLEMCGSKGHS